VEPLQNDSRGLWGSPELVLHLMDKHNDTCVGVKYDVDETRQRLVRGFNPLKGPHLSEKGAVIVPSISLENEESKRSEEDEATYQK
jgi:hypothetical protein